MILVITCLYKYINLLNDINQIYLKKYINACHHHPRQKTRNKKQKTDNLLTSDLDEGQKDLKEKEKES